MLTQEDIQNLKEAFATKNEIKELIEPLATKASLSNLSIEIVNIKEIMATKEDIGRLSFEIVNIRETMATKDEVREIDEKFNKLIDSIDRLTKKVDDYFQETVSTTRALKRHEKWIQQLAAKLDIKLEY
ncbi:MAG TPA: hypothetical protein ENN28_03815 [Candidatus Uhrbacteria bacterium]|nr:hypothetical protein [Candidatus Uhrbacteria bacterium]